MRTIPDGVHLTLQQQYRRCSRKNCRCHRGPANQAHGPYWFGYWRDAATGKLHSHYIGKTLPDEIVSRASQKRQVPT